MVTVRLLVAFLLFLGSGVSLYFGLDFVGLRTNYLFETILVAIASASFAIAIDALFYGPDKKFKKKGKGDLNENSDNGIDKLRQEEFNSASNWLFGIHRVKDEMNLGVYLAYKSERKRTTPNKDEAE